MVSGASASSGGSGIRSGVATGRTTLEEEEDDADEEDEDDDVDLGGGRSSSSSSRHRRSKPRSGQQQPQQQQGVDQELMAQLDPLRRHHLDILEEVGMTLVVFEHLYTSIFPESN